MCLKRFIYGFIIILKVCNRSSAEDKTIANTSQRIADAECSKMSALPEYYVNLFPMYPENRADPGEFPHVVSLGYERVDQKSYDFLCSGSLVSDSYVLTAARCVANFMRPNIVRVGLIEIADRTQYDNETDIKIAETICHPSYNRQRRTHNLALLRLEKPVQFSASVYPICLYTKANTSNMTLTATAWSEPELPTWNNDKWLLKENVKTMGLNECRQVYEPYLRRIQITDEYICASDPMASTKIYGNYLGGSLHSSNYSIRQYHLVGVGSYSCNCRELGPTLFTLVLPHLDWIESVVWPKKS